MFKFIFSFFILAIAHLASAEIEVPVILIVEENGLLKTNCSSLDCPELALILNYKFQLQNLDKNTQNFVLPYQANIPISDKQNYEILIP